MKTGIWGALSLSVVLSFWGCSGSDTKVLAGGTGGAAAKSGGAAAKSGGAAPAAGGALSSGGSGGNGGMLSTTCPATEPTGNLLNCTGTASGTSCPYAVDVCTCTRNVWACQNPLCPVAQPTAGEACIGLENANCRYRNRNVCDCKAGAWKCFQTQSQNCPPKPPANGTPCPTLGGTFCDYELLMSSLDVGSAGAAGAGNAAGAAGVAGAPTVSGGAASGGASTATGGAGNTAGAAGSSTPLACGCSPQNQKWYCF